MTVYCVTGKPGAGKTAYAVDRVILKAARRGRMVATNVPMNPGWESMLARVPGRSEAWRNQRAFKYQANTHVVNRWEDLFYIGLACDVCGSQEPWLCSIERGHRASEGRGVAVMDESSQKLNARTWDIDPEMDSKKAAVQARLARIDFLKEHRKLGWDVYLVSQDLDMLDKQVRELVEYEIRMRNIKNAKMVGIPLSFGRNLCVGIHVWREASTASRVYVSKREILGVKRAGRYYNTHGVNDETVAGRYSQIALWLPRMEVLAPGADEPSALARASATALEPGDPEPR